MTTTSDRADAPPLDALRREAMDALRQGRFDLADALLARGEVTLEELTHNLRVYQAELEAQAQELREANERLDAAVQRFRRLFDAMPQPALVVDRVGQVLRTNMAADELLGIDAGTVLKPALRRMAADEAARTELHRVLAEAQSSGHGRASGVALVDSHGATQPTDIYVERLVDPGADAGEQYLVIVVDERERVAAAQQLRAANQALRTQQRDNRMLAAVARSTLQGVVVTDARRRVTWVNGAFERATGWRLDEIAGRSLGLLQGPATDPATVGLMRERLDAGEGFEGLEVLNYTRAGEPYWVRLDVQPVLGEDGLPEAFVSVQSDVTVQRRTEANLREAEAFQRAVLESAPVLIATVRPDARVGTVNIAGLAMLQVQEPAQAGGRPLADFVDPGSRDTVARQLARALLGESVSLRVTLRGERGRTVPVSLSMGPLWDGGEVKMVVVVGRDVSAEQALLAERAAKEAALASSQAKTRFLSQMSHELRTPLNAVLGFAQVMRSDLDLGHLDPGALAQRLAFIEQAGWHLLAMIDDVLDFSQIEAGNVGVHIGPVPCADVIGDALSMLQPQAQRADVSLEGPAAGWPLVAAADPVRLKQVLFNLLSNAIKFNRHGGRVRVEARADAGGVAIDVSDTGVGLRADQLERLFEPFNRLDAPSRVAGSGIGLAIAHRLTALMGGRLSAASTPGAGSTFTVWLPGVGGATAVEARDADADDAPAAAMERRWRVLYIEDVESNVDVVRHALAPTAWQLEVASTGASGIAAAAAAPPNVILLDLQLPDMDGVDVRRRLLADPATASVPCIAVTADVAARQREQLAVPFDRWMSKPLRLRALRRAMAEVMTAAEIAS
jgi:PAS domain S-box-containing protein